LAAEATPPRPERASRSALRRVAIALLAFVVLLVLLAWLLPTPRVANLLLGRVGTSLGLELSAAGPNEYRLRDTPTLVLRDVVAREPGAASPLFRASRVYVSLPWSTVRARGASLEATRLELEAPTLDLPALQHWLATRPPTAEKRLPSLTHGLQVHDGTLLADNWRIDDIAIDAHRFVPTERLDARVRGRYVAAPLSAALDLALSLASPDALFKARATGLGISGTVAVEHARDWRLPMRILLSGPLRIADAATITSVRIGIVARYESGTMKVPFALGLRGPLRIGDAVVLAPAALTLRGRATSTTDLVPALNAQAVLAWKQRLVLQLRGTLADWPEAWPALPAPLDASRTPLPVALDYSGRTDFSDAARLALTRDETRFDAQFHLPEVIAWTDSANTGSPLPPLDGHLSTPRLDIGGMRLEGVEMDIDNETRPVDGR
jgi:hypothetical protein